MKKPVVLMVVSLCLALTACLSSGMTPTATPASELEAAEHVLRIFFDALSRQDYEEAAKYHLVPNSLALLFPDLDRRDAESLLTRACTPDQIPGCEFHCLGIKDVSLRLQDRPNEFVFHVRFETKAGDLLIGGSNITPGPCLPTNCVREEHIYQVVKRDGEFFVDGIPVFSGCWP